jgi:hypothetical protein
MTMVEGTVSTAFAMALALQGAGDPAPLDAHCGLTPGKSWGKCSACEKWAVLGVSGFSDMRTCTPCESEFREVFHVSPRTGP